MSSWASAISICLRTHFCDATCFQTEFQFGRSKKRFHRLFYNSYIVSDALAHTCSTMCDVYLRAQHTKYSTCIHVIIYKYHLSPICWVKLGVGQNHLDEYWWWGKLIKYEMKTEIPVQNLCEFLAMSPIFYMYIDFFFFGFFMVVFHLQ